MPIENPFGIDTECAAAAIKRLTPREREVANGIANGKTRCVLAIELGIAPKTLDIHLFNLRKKLGCMKHGIGRIWFAAKFNGKGDTHA